MNGRKAHRWPLILIALPAATAIWSGWVGLGALCGFGPVQLLPGITDWTLNTAITLPVGAEAYAIYALHAYISPGTPEPAKRFAFWSSLGAGLYGITGQVTFHLLTSAGRSEAPPPVVVFVSCMPVAVVMLAAVLTHLLNEPGETAAGTVSPPVFTDAQTAALTFYGGTVAAGNPLTQNKLAAQFRLSRAEARDVIERSRGGPPARVPVAAPAVVSPAAAGALNGRGASE